MAVEQMCMWGPAERVDRERVRGRCDWAPEPWERENLWPSRLAEAVGAEACEMLWGDVPRMTRLMVEQVCRRLAVDSNTVYRLIEQGELDAVNVGAGSVNPLYRVYRYSLVWFLFRREFAEAGADTRPAMLANLGAGQARALASLAEQVRREK